MGPPFLHFLKRAATSQLDGAEFSNGEGAQFTPVDQHRVVGQIHDRPDTAAQKPLVPVDQIIADVNPVNAQVDQLGPGLILCLHQPNLDFVNDAVAALFPDLGFKPFRLVGVDVMLVQYPLDLL